MKKKILIIGPTPPPYMGPSIATKMIIESELKDKFHLIHLDTADRRSLNNLGKFDFQNVYLAVFHILKLFWLLIKYTPQIVYIPISQSTMGFFRDAIFIFIAKAWGAKVIIHLRGSYFRQLYQESNIFVKLLIRSALRCTSRDIVLGKSLKYIFKGFVPFENIVVVSNGIDKNYIPNTVKQESSKGTRVLFLSNFMKTKGFIDVIKAIPDIVEKHKNIEFIFAGEWRISEDEKQKVYQFLNQNELDKTVKFLGVVTGDKKRNLLFSSDVFILPSHNEGQPWVIIEAMAAGLPIIATDTGTIKEMVIDGKNGFIVEKKNPEQIAERILILLENEDLRRKMGKNSRERFLKYYTKEKFIGSLSKIFEQVLAE